MADKKIPFKGNYWWGDSDKVISLLKKELEDILGRTRVSSIEIRGTDFNDGRENHLIEIRISNNEIMIKKQGGA